MRSEHQRSVYSDHSLPCALRKAFRKLFFFQVVNFEFGLSYLYYCRPGMEHAEAKLMSHPHGKAKLKPDGNHNIKIFT